MAGTSWNRLIRPEPREWLLGDGTVITEPPLETSGSGIKVRVVGASDTAYARDLHTMLTKAAEKVADKRNTVVLAEITNGFKSRFAQAMKWKPWEEASAILGPVHDPENRSNVTHTWWKFQLPGTPFEAYLTVTLTGSYNLDYTRRVNLWLPVRRFNHDDTTTMIHDVENAGFANVTSCLRNWDSNTEERWDEWIAHNTAPNTAKALIGQKTTSGARAAVRDLLEVVRKIEALDRIEVPDFRYPDDPGWMTLELVATNVSGHFVSDMTEYLDATPVVERALEHYTSLMALLRSMGLDVTPTTDDSNDFAAAMLSGNLGVLNMSVSNPVHEPDTPFLKDTEHSVSVHIPTGTFVVTCNHRVTSDPDEVAQKWEEHKTIARLTGSESELLAFARGYAQQQAAGVPQKIIAARS